MHAYCIASFFRGLISSGHDEWEGRPLGEVENSNRCDVPGTAGESKKDIGAPLFSVGVKGLEWPSLIPEVHG